MSRRILRNDPDRMACRYKSDYNTSRYYKRLAVSTSRSFGRTHYHRKNRNRS